MKTPIQKVVVGFPAEQVAKVENILPKATMKMLQEIADDFNAYSLVRAKKEAVNGEIPIFFEMDILKVLVELVADKHEEIYPEKYNKEKTPHKVVTVDLATDSGKDMLEELLNILPSDIVKDITKTLNK